MRHRMGMAQFTGIGGNNSPVLLDNKGELDHLNRTVLDEAIEIYFKEIGGCDYGISENEFKFGIEPAYLGDDLKIISINKIKENSYIETGHAFNVWGSGLRTKRKYYKDYKKNGKLKKLIEKWHKLIFKR